MARTSGSPTSFWSATAAGAGAASTAVEIGRGTESVTVYITTNGATTVAVEVAHSGAVGADGTTVDANANNWAPLYYLNGKVEFVFAGAGSVAMIIPDFAPRWIRLKTTNAVTLTAGHEASSG